MSDIAVNQATFALGRYSKRKRTQVTYCLSELDVSDSDSDFDTPQTKKQRAKTTSRPLPKRQIFPFMKLPAEIRNMVYAYALIDPSGINLVATFKHKRRTVERVSEETQSNVASRFYYQPGRLNDEVRAKCEVPISLAPSLLAVSKQVHYEAREVLYSNEFIFADTFALYNLLINLGPSGAKQLKTLRLLGWGYGRAMKAYNHACFAVLAWATNITAFHIDCTTGWRQSPKSSAEQIYRDAFPWLEAVGRETGTVDAAIDIIKVNVETFETRHWNGTSQVIIPGQQNYAKFKAALSKLLDVQQKRVLAKPTKRRKISKTDEL
ncbi:Nn.00g102340.m01.CDS01 [Neocucurbitaria sp. VM-36]